jgi:PAS domain S-box-containing protein
MSNPGSERPAEAALRQREDSFRLLVEQVRDYAIFLLDPQGYVQTWNAGAERLKGYRAEDIIGQHFSRFYPEEAVRRGWPQHELEVARAAGRFEDEGWRLRKDGSRFWANVVITAVHGPGGELVGFAKVTRDLTERKKVEEELRQSEERFRLLVESVNDYAIVMLDPGGRVASWNAGAARTMGYAPDEIVGRHFSRFYPAEDVAAGKPDRELRVAAAEGRFEDEGWRLRKDGSRFWANTVITALRDEAGVLRGFAKVTRDITERRRAEEALRRARDELEARVHERTAALSDANARLAEAARRKDEFLAMLAHELRNPLAPVRNALQILLLAEEDARLRERARAMMERQVVHMARLVDDLLDVSRITRGKIQLRQERVDFARLVQTAAEDRRRTLEDAGVALRVDVPDEPVWVTGDPTRLTQVVGNLLDNAAKFTDRGGRAEVAVARDAAARRAVLTVRDTGIGIDAAMLANLFDPFAQADRSLERTRGGLGLGLALVKGLAELHGGEVAAHSEGPGRGTEFTVRLPLADGAAAGGRAPGAPGRAGRLRVLVIEDGADAAESLRMLLDLMGHEALVARSGLEGVRAAAAVRPDVVLCDLGLPGLDGYGVARALRADPATAGARLIAVSGYGRDDDVRRALEAGFEQHLTKPVEPGLLRSLLAAIHSEAAGR